MVKRTSSGDVVKVSNIAHSENIFDPFNFSLVVAGKDLVNVFDDGRNVRRAVGRHVGPDWLEILPEIPRGSLLSSHLCKC
jgi:hypothetical protein